jgi:HEAT repeat protein
MRPMHRPRIRVICLAILLAAIGPKAFFGLSRQEDRVQLLIRQLGNQDFQVRNQAARELGDLQDPRAVEPLVAALLDPSRGIILNVARALGKIKDARAIDPLISVLKAKDEGHRSFAAEALGEIGDSRAVLPLLPLLKDADIGTRGTAAEALRKIQGVASLESTLASKVEAAISDAVPALIEAIRSGDGMTRNSAAGALMPFKDARAVEPLLSLLKDESAGTRGKAARSLGLLKDSRAIEPLRLQMINETDLFARNCAAWALRDMGSIAVPALSSVVKTGTGEARSVAASMLYGTGAAGTEALISLAREPDIEVRIEAARGLGLVHDERAVEPLISLLKDPDARARAAAVRSLQFYPDTRSVEPLVACLSDKDPRVRKIAAEAFAQLKSPPAIAPLIVLLNDPNRDIQRAAEDALSSYGEAASDALVIALQAGNPALLERVAGLLARTKVERGQLVPILKSKNKMVRLFAAIILFEKGDPAGQEHLVLFLTERNPDIKLSAAGKLLGGGEETRHIVTSYTLKARDIVLAGYFYKFFIENGIEGSESVLCEALKKSDSMGMAEDFLNSGNMFLSTAAQEWASKKGYRMVSKPGKSGLSWGKLRRL